MDKSKVSDRTLKQLEKLPPEKRAAAERVIAKTQTKEYRDKVAAQRAQLAQEIEETGGVVVKGPAGTPVGNLFEALQRARIEAGLTLAQVSERSGIDQPALSRLESGQNENPTLNTLKRYAEAVGKELVVLMR